ncbi:hypothetical protein [Sphingomonas sp. Leaf25]|uniref:hypothetical protein n=1 Tax=Sphingomonas sp. Leaf25 TaxID=1735692 RepID=UPI000700071B|nr:hypothetical protein [Sphingomonas sp. Leaf25]KQN00432.1 hypothetical protein ASE78_04800 [Sphingomonas sp. Leaf25]
MPERWTSPRPGLSLLRRGHAPIRAIQVYGQRCSGTNVLIRSIEANLGPAAFTESCGFKHWFVPEQVLFPRDVMVLVIARDAVDWVRSLHRQPWHAHPELKALGFSDFIRAPWHSYWDQEFWGVDSDHPVLGREMLHERCPMTGDRFANPLAKRTAKLRHWSELGDRAHHVALLGQDAFLADPQGVIDALAAATGLTRSEPFVSHDSYKGQGFRKFVPTRYDRVSDADLAHIHAWLDPDVEARFGFDIPAAQAQAAE